MWGPCLSPFFFFYPQIKLCVSMPVTYLIWDAPLSSPHLTAAHTDSTLLPTSVTLTPPEEQENRRMETQRSEWRMDRNMKSLLFCSLKLSFVHFRCRFLKMIPLSSEARLWWHYIVLYFFLHLSWFILHEPNKGYFVKERRTLKCDVLILNSF